MPTLHIRNMLPAGEKVILSIDGEPQTGTILSVPESFCLRLEQYRISSSAKGVAGMVGQFLSVLAFGGGAEWGEELSSPFYAVWEGTCQMSGDGEIELWLKEEGMEVNFVPWSDTVSFRDVRHQTGGRNPVEIGRWALMTAPLLLFVSTICLILMFFAFWIDTTQDLTLWIPRLVFLIFPAYGLKHIWSSTLRPFMKQKSVDWEKRAKRRLTIQLVVLVVMAGAAVFEILSFWVFDFEPATITCFPATVLLIIHLLATVDFEGQAQRGGIRSEELEIRLRWIRELRLGVCAAFAVIILVLIVEMVRR